MSEQPTPEQLRDKLLEAIAQSLARTDPKVRDLLILYRRAKARQ